MKKLILSIISVVAIFAYTRADTLPIDPISAADSSANQHVITFLQNVEQSRSLTVAVYPIYAPDIVVNGKKDTFGGGLALLCPVSAINALSNNVVAQHSFAGLRFDYLAHQAFASTVSLGLRGDMQLWGHDFMGYVHAGANIPLSGFSTSSIGAMAGGGGYTSLWTFPHGSLGLQASAEKWTQFAGVVFLGGPVVNLNW